MDQTTRGELLTKGDTKGIVADKSGKEIQAIIGFEGFRHPELRSRCDTEVAHSNERRWETNLICSRTRTLVTTYHFSKISWFEPVSDNGDIQWVEHLIDDEIIWPGDVCVDDIDQDGDLDLVVAGMGEARVIWYENKISKSLKSGSLISMPDGKRGWLVSSAIEAVVP